MTQEVLKLSQEALAGLKDVEKQVRELVAENKALKEALAQTELCKYGQDPKSCTSSPMDCQCAIDASLAQTQEPVACEHKRTSIWTEDQTGHCNDCGASGRMRFIADTTPPQRTWVGLTDEEIDKLRSGYQSGRIGSFVALAQAIEAKLKEKNGYAEENT